MGDEGAVTVCVRVRPIIARENALEDKVSVQWKSENNTISEVNGTKVFTYDRVFHSSDNTQQLYEGVAVPIIESAVQGYNGTIFAYGQTASGKTYTMMGNKDSVGIIPRAIQHIFKVICEIPEREFLLRVSYMEIYNETITDLLCDIRKKKPLGIREDVNRNTYVEDLIEEVVVSPEQVMEWIRKGEKNRHYGETKMNEHSSRSHTIFRMIIESRERSDPANANCDGAVMVSHLNLVDLAGSERASQTGSEGVRLKEGCNINRSLFILGQVIKKLCDDPSGFINYRDSKLTRILQNSLGGNAKTVIICTITPVSFDETLSTLQFANTAKRMKNTPKVNEVLDDDALLKRYRKEILDLKKQLEEVSSKTQIHAMEKDQLAQLLEEKNSLQKVQEDRIRNLTEMLVTSASFSSKQNAKAKRRRRVTWAPGKINQANVSYFEDFEKPGLTETKKMKMSLLSLPDIEDSILENPEQDNQCLVVPDQISEAEWTAGPNVNWRDFEESVQLCEALALEKNVAVNEINTLQANFNNLELENEQLKLEINEIKEKLKEKLETEEFEALEKQTQKDHEEQLMYEITNLKNLVSNAEVYNEELEAEINSKLEQLKEKENKIKILQNRVEELEKAAVEKKDTRFSVGDPDKLKEEIRQLNKSLLDSETIALDAKKESAFLRTENLELKEKMNELLNNCNQMQKDVQVYQSQIEAGKANYKKMQAELQKELQSVFQENRKLISLMEGKVPKDLLSLVELEKRATDLKGDLEKALKENALLQEQVNELSKFQSLPITVEIQQKELSGKMKELENKTAEHQQLIDVREDFIQAQQKSNEMEQLKEQEKIMESRLEAKDSEIQAVLQQLTECREEIKALTQERDHLKQKEESFQTEMDQLKEDIKDTVSMNILAQEELRNAQSSLKQSQDTVKILKKNISEKESQVLSVEEALGKTIKDLKIQISQMTEEIKIVTSERDQLAEEKAENTCKENDELQALKEQIFLLTQENSSLQNKLDNLHLKKEEYGEGTLIPQIQEKSIEQELFVLREELSQAQRKLHEMEKAKANECQRESEKMGTTDCIPKLYNSQDVSTLTETEDDNLKMQLENLQNERDCLRETVQETTSKNSEMQEELRCARNSLRQHQETIDELKGSISEKENELLKAQEAAKETTDELQRKIQQLTETLNSISCEKDQLLAERTSHSFQLKEQISSINREKDELQQLLQGVRSERDQLKRELQKISEMCAEANAKLESALDQLKQRSFNDMSVQVNSLDAAEQVIADSLEEKTLKIKLNEVTENLTHVSSEYDKLLREKEEIERTMNENIRQQLEKIALLNQEKDELQQMVQTCKAERDQLETESLESKEKSLKVLTEMQSLQEELKHQKEQVDIQKNLLASGEERLRNTEGNLNEEINKLQEKVVKLTEDLNLVTRERHQLLGELEKAESESSKLPQLQKQCDMLVWERDQLQEKLEGLQAEKNKLEANLQEGVDKVLETEKELKRQQDLLSNEKVKAEEREEHLLKVQRQSEILEDNLTNKIQQLTETLNSVSCEKDQLLAERSSLSFQLKEQISSINREKDELQQLLQGVRSERDQLERELQNKSEMCAEANAKLESALDQLKQRSFNDMSVQVNSLDAAEQMVADSLEEKTLKIKELLERFPDIGKRYECLSTVSLDLKKDLNSQKALIDVILTQLSSEQSKQVERLQIANEKINGRLQSLLNKLKFLFSRVCMKKREYYTTVHKYEMELLEEKRKQDQLRAQIQFIRKTYLNQNEISSQELNSSEGLQSLHLDAESILKDISEMESELLSIEAELQQEESARKETARFWEACSGNLCDAEELKEELNKDNERLWQVIKFWTPKVKVLLQLSSELDARTASYCKNADGESKQRKEKSKELLQELNSLKEQLAPGGSASLALEEELCSVRSKLKAAEQDAKAMEVKIQKLENVINEAGKNMKEKDDKINKLRAQIRMQMDTNELTQLQEKLNATEKHLGTSLAENQRLQAKLDKGAELYKEEIDNLKTQLVKRDMERMKQSKYFDIQLANYKAVAEHKEQQLRKLKEELRRVQQDQDVSVLGNEAPQQPQMALTCGGGSGIVQSTQILVLKSEQAKLQKENLHLKKQNDILQSNELELKEELRKWKERALKWKERSSRGITDTVPRSPMKTVPYSPKEQMASPSKESISQETPVQNISQPLPQICPYNFLDISSLDLRPDTQPAEVEPRGQLERWFGTSEKDKAPDCITQ